MTTNPAEREIQDMGALPSATGLSQAEPQGRLGPSGFDPSRDDDHRDLDDYDDYDDLPENAVWCDRCQGLGMAECHCGGDQCYCENYGEMECPRCHGEGYFVPKPGQLEREAASQRAMQDIIARAMLRDSDGSPQGRDAERGSIAEGDDSAAPKGIAP